MSKNKKSLKEIFLPDTNKGGGYGLNALVMTKPRSANGDFPYKDHDEYSDEESDCGCEHKEKEEFESINDLEKFNNKVQLVRQQNDEFGKGNNRDNNTFISGKTRGISEQKLKDLLEGIFKLGSFPSPKGDLGNNGWATQGGERYPVRQHRLKPAYTLKSIIMRDEKSRQRLPELKPKSQEELDDPVQYFDFEKDIKKEVKLLLGEGKLDLLKLKYPDLEVEEVYNSDPSSTKKYTEWMLRQIKDGFKKEDMYPTINFFNKNQAKFKIKDINQYKNLKELEDLVKDISLNKQSSTETKKMSKEGAVKLWEDDQLILYRIDTKDACMIYGKNTRWCITMKDENYFNQYQDRGNVVFYYLIRKNKQNNPLDKIAFAVQRDENNKPIKTEIFDSEDQNIPNPNLLDYTDGFNQIYSIIFNDASKRPTTFWYKFIRGIATKEEILDYLQSDDLKTRQRYSIEDLVERLIDLDSSLKESPILLKHKNNWVRYSIFRLLETTEYPKFIKDPDENIRKIVAEHIDKDYLPEMINDKNILIRIKVASRIHKNFLLKMMEDEDESVRNEALKRLDIKYVPRFLNDESELIRFKAKNRLKEYGTNTETIESMKGANNKTKKKLHDYIRQKSEFKYR